MAKKKKKKFKKKHLKPQAASLAPAEDVLDNEVDAPVKKSQTTGDSSEDEKTDEYRYIRKDVRNVLIIMAIMLIVIFAAFIIDKNTTVFSQFSDWLFKITNIQIN